MVQISVDEHSSRAEVFQLLHTAGLQSRLVHFTQVRHMQRQTAALSRQTGNSPNPKNPSWSRRKYLNLCSVLIMCGVLHVTNLGEFFEDTAGALRRSLAPVGSSFASGIASMKLWEVQQWLRNLSMEDRSKQYRPGHANHDKKFKVRALISVTNEAIRRHWLPGKWVAVDEILHPFRGRWRHIQKIAGKPGKGIGVKFWACCQCGTGMLLSVALYAGKENGAGNKRHVAASVVVSLLAFIFAHHPHAIALCIFDNYYTSLLLVLLLLKLFGIRSHGTVRALGKGARKGFPEAVKQPKGNVTRLRGKKKHAVLPSAKVHELIGSEDDANCRWDANKPVSVVALSWYDCKPVHMLSSFIGSSWCPWVRPQKRSGALTKLLKPLMTVFYTGTMNGVDLFDQKCALLRIHLRSRRWTNNVFFFVLIAHVVNAHMMWRSLRPECTESLKDFARALALELNDVLDAPLALFDYEKHDRTQVVCVTRKRRKAILRSTRRRTPRLLASPGAADNSDSSVVLPTADCSPTTSSASSTSRRGVHELFCSSPGSQPCGGLICKPGKRKRCT